MSTMDDLNKLRQELNDLDQQLISAVARRQQVVKKIGESKISAGTATRDFAREKEVVELARQRAVQQGVDPDIAESLMLLLIQTSLTAQEEARVVAHGAGSGQRALVIGGSGKMGQWFARFFQSQHYEVVIADPRVGAPEFRHCQSWQEAGLDFEVIVVATDLGLSASILVELAEQKPKGLVFDIGSLKTPMRDALQIACDAGLKIASLHPMFGPDTRLLSGRHLIFVDAGNPEASAAAQELFAATMVEQLEMSLEEHDRLIAYVLGLSHALNIAFFTALAESGEAAPRLATMSSTTFDAQMAVARQVAGESPDLYFEIQHLNDFGLHPLAALSEASDRLLHCVQAGDQEGFRALMDKGAEYFRATT